MFLKYRYIKFAAILLNSLVATIGFYLYSFQAQYFAEESTFYFKSLAKPFLMAVKENKDSGYFALPGHFFFRIGSFLSSDDPALTLVIARCICLTIVLYIILRSSWLIFKGLNINNRSGYLYLSLLILLFIGSFNTASLITFNIPYYFLLLSLGILISETNNKDNSYRLSFIDILDCLLLALFTLSKPLIIPGLVATLLVKSKIIFKARSNDYKLLYASIATILLLSVLGLLASILNIFTSDQNVFSLNNNLNINNNPLMMLGVDSNSLSLPTQLTLTLGYITLGTILLFNIFPLLKRVIRFGKLIIVGSSSNSIYLIRDNLEIFAELIFLASPILAIITNLLLIPNFEPFSHPRILFSSRHYFPIFIGLTYIFLIRLSSPRQIDKHLISREANLFIRLFTVLPLSLIGLNLLFSIRKQHLLRFGSNMINLPSSSFILSRKYGNNCYIPSPPNWNMPYSLNGFECSLIDLPLSKETKYDSLNMNKPPFLLPNHTLNQYYLEGFLVPIPSQLRFSQVSVHCELNGTSYSKTSIVKWWDSSFFSIHVYPTRLDRLLKYNCRINSSLARTTKHSYKRKDLRNSKLKALILKKKISTVN